MSHPSEGAPNTPDVIKIVTRISPSKKAPSAQEEYHTIIHWDRIIIVAALLLIAVVAITILTYRALTEPSQNDTAPALVQQSTEPAPTPPLVENTSPSITTNATPAPMPAPTPEKNNATPIEQPMDDTTQKLISDANSELSEASPSAGSVEPEKPTVQILSSDINRATFSHRIDRNKEPEQEINRIVTLDPSGLSKVHFFTDIKNRAGDTFTHTWFRDGKQVVKVRIPIGSDTWRCSSSKYLDKNMAGQWEVKITDKKGELVASGAFTFNAG